MNSPRLISVIASSFLLLVPAAARGEETEASRAPTRFLELLHVGDRVRLMISSDHPTFYNIQLLSTVHAEEIQTAYDAYDELRQRRDAIVVQIGAERQISERAVLFAQQQKLEAEMANVSSVRQLGTLLYEVAQVAEDFVAFKRPGLEKFVPLHSIRDMYRTDELPQYRSPSLDRRSPTNQFAVAERIRLENTTVAEVAAAINLVYPDLKAKLTADVASNTLLVEGDRASALEIKKLVDILDTTLPEATPPTNEGER